MKSYDFNVRVQKTFQNLFIDTPKVDWKAWLEISSVEEYEQLSLELSGLDGVNSIQQKLKQEPINSAEFSVDVKSILTSSSNLDSLIFCHSSGTTNSKISALKWFHMSREVVERNWAPGMQAIFESSELDSKTSAVIFVPSRTSIDGINKLEGKEYISLYSSEFSQRLMLSIIKPFSYLLYEYRNSKSIDVISQMLSLENISVISAPAATVLGWADLEKLKAGLRNSLEKESLVQNPIYEKLLLCIKNEGLNIATKKIQQKLSAKLRNACLVFSISSLSENDWQLIRNFMAWEKGEEKYTNLYVASEVGPIAASIHKGDFELARLKKMFVFPLFLPVIQYKDKKELISRAKSTKGELLVSRLGKTGPLINIRLGDIIIIKSQKGLPQIEGTILRSGFQLKYPINVSKKVRIPSNHMVLAGNYFNFENFEVYDPNGLKRCINNNCNMSLDCLLLVKSNDDKDSEWSLYLQKDTDSKCTSPLQIKTIISKCSNEKEFREVIKNDYIKMKIITDEPISFYYQRSAMIKRVQSGEIPKGILKKWPLYIILPESSKQF